MYCKYTQGGFPSFHPLYHPNDFSHKIIKNGHVTWCATSPSVQWVIASYEVIHRQWVKNNAAHAVLNRTSSSASKTLFRWPKNEAPNTDISHAAFQWRFKYNPIKTIKEARRYYKSATKRKRDLSSERFAFMCSASFCLLYFDSFFYSIFHYWNPRLFCLRKPAFTVQQNPILA